MDSRDNHLNQLIDALPSHFQFYHLGEVKMNLPSSPLGDFPHLKEDSAAIAFQLYGDIRATLILLFPKDLDISLYCEMGNIIASRIVTQLNRQREIEIMISPPHPLNEERTKMLLKEGNSSFHRTYAHLYGNSVITLETFILPGPLEGVGYA